MLKRVSAMSMQKIAIVAFAFIVLFLGATQSFASKTDLVSIRTSQAQVPTVTVVQGMAEILDVKGAISDIMVADPSIVDVSALQSNRLYLVGLNLGFTNMIVLDAQGNVLKRVNVMVTIDTSNVQNIIERMFPDEDVKVEALRGQIILSGTASSPDMAQRIVNLVLHHITDYAEGESANIDEAIVNLIKIRGKSQVMLRVKVMEISRSLLRERSTDTDIDDIGYNFAGDLTNGSQLDGVFGGVINTGTSEPPFAAFGLLERFGAFGPVETLLTLLEDEGLARILAEPNLTAVSGEQAGFLAGGEFPVPAGTDETGNVLIQFRQFGVSLGFQPVVMSEDRISMQLETEVSSLSRDSNVVLANIEVPGLDVRRASTTVEMGSGTTLMIAGLLQSQTVKNLSGMPGITKTPILGDLMSSENFRREETEMVVLVTPYIVEPYGDKKQAQEIPLREKEKNYLPDAFAKNIRRTFGEIKISGLFDDNVPYGYILD